MAKKGGTSISIGLVLNVMSSLLENNHRKSGSKSFLASTCTTVLGNLLDVTAGMEANAVPTSGPSYESSSSIISVDGGDKISQSARKDVEALAEAIDIGQADLQVAEASAFSDTSSHIAANSERLLTSSITCVVLGLRLC